MSYIEKTPPYVYPLCYDTQEGNRIEVRILDQPMVNNTSHVEIWIKPLTGGQNILNIPVMADTSSMLWSVRVRSRSENVKLTLTSAPIYEVGKDIHPRSIIWQDTTKEKDTIFSLSGVYVYGIDTSRLIKTYLSVENNGGDTDGISTILTFIYQT